ncbi:MAG: hypothetical protein F6J87_12470 [Spirulina sp. SIO3F2]|nr:hypothetical protein [Spirulina sp. SIO3F2]
MQSDSSRRLLAKLSLQTQLQQLCAPLSKQLPWSAVIRPSTPLVLYRVKQTYPIVYRSPLLQQLRVDNIVTFAEQFLNQLPPHPHWQIQLTAQGRLEFQWREEAIAPYLQALRTINWKTDAEHQALPLLQLTTEQLQLQYCQGRCSSLLRLAQRDGWTVTEQPDWLSLAAEGDRTFFSVWLDCGDRLAMASHPLQLQNLKLLLSLAQAWHIWYAQSQIWGIAKEQPPHLAQARLGIIYLTQQLLSWSLQEMGGVTPWRSA